MRNFIHKGISFVLVLTMTVFCMSGCGSTKDAEKVTKNDSPKKEDVNMKELLASKVDSGKDTEKSESVFVEMDAYGNIFKTTVSNVLKVSGTENISDVSDLKDIVNLSGNEKFAQDSEKLIWENKGKDIKYQGTTTKEPPISIDITYYLDGKKISSGDLAGKSGKVKIVYNYINNEKDENGEFVPFMVLTGMILDKDVFSNINIDNGKVIDYDDSSIIIGYGAPGVKDYLLNTINKADEYISDIDVPHGFALTADVKNFSMEMALTAAASDIGDMDISDTLDFSDLESRMNELKNGTDELEKGSNDLNKGAVKLKDGVIKIENGAKDVKKYTIQLFDGSTKLYDSYRLFDKSLMDGVKNADLGAKKLYKGTKDVKSASVKLNSGAKEINKAAGDVKSGASQIVTGLDNAKSAFEDVKDASGNVTKQGLNNGSKALATGAKQANEGVKELADTLQKTPDSIKKQIDGIIAQVSSATGGMISNKETLNGTVEAINGAVEQGMELSKVLASKNLSAKSYYSLVQAYYSIQTLEQVKSTFESQISAKENDIKTLLGGMNTLESGLNTLSGGIGELYTGISVLDSGARTLSAGTIKMSVGTKTLSDGTGQLKSGAGTLNAGMKTLSDGTKEMNTKLGKASPQIKDGIKTINSGAGQISSGAGTLADGTNTLGSGIVTLADGTKTLKDGVIKLNKEGISKITGLFGDDAKNAIDSIEDMLNVGKKYNSFSGINENMSGSVKFIFKTSEIETESDK